ncbi:hypothetical protein TsFJ059_008159 [Trichoderma semiorbis]|uniref:Zn(2)-C6 fungal-type domain-containing protein n=1 Tax=Trichoderma semiorbis TaxID=1491008 RepID=A0A9P8HDH9_9HYPO|nr:hypothetical protein TsFJ059_008159 [Trichoderma semiorbis]
MPLTRKSLTCPRCSRRFTRASSLTRHCKRCLQDIKGPSRRKSCRACARAKLRCDLQRPRCSRCEERTLTCEYVSRDGTTIVVSTAEKPTIRGQLKRQGDQFLLDNKVVDGSTVSATQKDASESDDVSTVDCGAESTPRSQEDTSQDTTSDRDGTADSVTTESEINHEVLENIGSANSEPIAPELVISNYRRRLLLNEARRTPNTDPVARHTMHFVIRVLKSWPRMMGSHLTSQLPAMIHRLQLADGIPIPLANCCTLAKMWIMHSEESRDLVQRTVHNEVRRLLRDYHEYNEMELLAAAQSMLILLIILFFGLGHSPALAHPIDAQLLVDMWNVKHKLASTGLFLDQESNHTLPSWKEWAMVSAKRRTIVGLHHLEFAWSLRFGYPILTCFELGPFPAPAARYLWQSDREEEWRRLYKDWLKQWADGGSYKMTELFRVNGSKESDALDPRSELWLAEADEFGMMLMAEANGIGVEF